MKRVIFLDIDGVLNHGYDPVRGGASGFNYAVPSCVTALNALVRATGAVVVISSAWREVHTLAEIQEVLRSFGVRADIVGATPTDLEGADRLPLPRICEIRAWLDLEPDRTVASFVVLDDLDIRLDVNNVLYTDAEIESRFVRTSTAEGLTSEQALQAAHHLARL